MRSRSRSVASMNEYFEDDSDEEGCMNVSFRESMMDERNSWDSDMSCCSPRVRRCSHDRRISFDDEVEMITIPSLESLDEDTKRAMWYSAEEFKKMRG